MIARSVIPLSRRFSRTSTDIRESVRTELSPVSKRAGDVLLSVNVANFDAAWSKDDGYIAKGEEGIRGRRKRFEEFYRHLQTVEGALQAPEVTVREDGSVSFINGRHRFSVQRDAGVSPIYVGFTKDSVRLAEKYNLIAKNCNPPGEDDVLM